MFRFLHNNDGTDTMAMATPDLFSENSLAKRLPSSVICSDVVV